MTLFISGPRRQYAISDFYVMVLTFIIVFWVTTIVKQALQKQKNQKKKSKKIKNPRGGALDLNFHYSDESELGYIILSCIADNEQYLVKSQAIKDLIFRLAKQKIKNETLVLTPNLIRLFALKLISEDKSVIGQIGNVVISSDNRIRLMVRMTGAALIAIVGAVFSVVPYAILMMLTYFDLTSNCGYTCNKYFEHLPSNEPIIIYADKPVGHLAITDNNLARQVEIYVKNEPATEIISTKDQKIVKTKYKCSRKKAKLQTFANFKQTDPVLSQFKDIPEPEIPQKRCSINDIDAIQVRID